MGKYEEVLKASEVIKQRFIILMMSFVVIFNELPTTGLIFMFRFSTITITMAVMVVWNSFKYGK